MLIQYPPPPPQPEYVEVRTIGTPQRFESPEQSQPDKGEQAENINNTVGGIAEGAGELAKAKNDADQQNEENSAITGNRDVAAGSGGESPRNEGQILDDINQGKYGDGFVASHPDHSSVGSNTANENISNQETTPFESNGESSSKGQSNDGGGYDYYNGIS